MKVTDIPDELLSRIREQFEATDEVRQLRVKMQYFQKVGKFAEAMELAKLLEELFTVALNGHIRKAESEKIVFDSEAANVPKEDKEDMMVYLTAVFMACDVIESAIMDMNSILHKSNPDVTITAFDDIRSLSSLAKKKLQYLQRAGDLMDDLAWGDRCDNMYDMMVSKARSLMRKRRESRDWGKNMERFRDGEGEG